MTIRFDTDAGALDRAPERDTQTLSERERDEANDAEYDALSRLIQLLADADFAEALRVTLAMSDSEPVLEG